ncbi:unnamed protein product [Soboliphyme baturini]|uniref:Uncharacterized protein n=1 Tax=Soboliphyme baturini TaxID=241478 RepID=A0A183IS81_9BILA|nr:unnamed protein product [Soboliphyme baturini]
MSTYEVRRQKPGLRSLLQPAVPAVGTRGETGRQDAARMEAVSPSSSPQRPCCPSVLCNPLNKQRLPLTVFHSLVLSRHSICVFAKMNTAKTTLLGVSRCSAPLPWYPHRPRVLTPT